MRKIIRTHLGFFRRAMPAEFDLKGASLGNLVLAGGYLNNDRHLDPVVFLFSKLAEVRGVVRPIVNKNLELAVDLEGGATVVGQHLITGREVPPLESPIKDIRLVRSAKDPAPIRPSIRDKTRRLIRSAELICYPLGSFFSSLLVNLLPRGVGRAVASADCPKVYIPNTGRDKEWVAGSVARPGGPPGSATWTRTGTMEAGPRGSWISCWWIRSGRETTGRPWTWRKSGSWASGSSTPGWSGKTAGTDWTRN